MTIGKCLQSIIIPHQNEFIFIWLYIGFAIYYWIQVVFILEEDSSYGFSNEDNYKWMLIATLGEALRVTVTLGYLIFYCMTQSAQKILRTVDLNF